MAPLGIVEPTARLLDPSVPAAVDWEVRFDETLAAGERLWVRGRLTRKGPAVDPVGADRSRWHIWGRNTATARSTPAGRLDISMGPQNWSVAVSLSAQGEFEAILSGQRPPPRRGWRLARQRLTLEGAWAEQCAVVLSPPGDATEAVVVVLPASVGEPPGGSADTRGIEQFLEDPRAKDLSPVLQRLRQEPGRQRAFYYLAGTMVRRDDLAARIALSTTTLGWPAGTVVVLPQPHIDPAPTFLTGLDRLRWLLSGRLAFRIFNLEPRLANDLAGSLGEQEDRAQVIEASDRSRRSIPGSAKAPLPEPGFASLTRRSARGILVLRHPVVFCHGMLGLTTLRLQIPEDWNCFRPLREFFEDRGLPALYPQVLPTGGVAARAEQLRDEISKWTDEPVNIIAHSMGGLDARYLITHLGMADRVRSLTTIATPHRGSYLVDWFIKNFRSRIPLLLAFEAAGFNVDGFRDCQRAACAAFNARTPNMPGVRYFSHGASVTADHVTPVLRRAWNLLAAVEGPNDGMVSVASARWGEYLGTLNVDHFAQTPDMTFVRPGEDFDGLAFYSRLLEDMARRGL